MSTHRFHQRSAAVVVFAMLLGAFQVPASAAPPQASITINDMMMTEGNAGTKVLGFTVKIKGSGTAKASVAWATEDVTATAGSDYNDGSGTVSFSSGKSQRINIAVLGDQIVEPDETFNINLSGPVNARITDPQGVGTIDDDDLAPELPALSIADDLVGEGNLGTTTPASFVVTMSKPATSVVTVNYATANGTAAAGADYTGAGGTITFAPGETTQPVVVVVLGDDLGAEADENFFVNLSTPDGATVADGVAIGTIVDDEGAPAVSIGDATVVEGAIATFPVTLSHPSAETVTVDWAAVAATASVPADFQAVSGQLNFEIGTTSQDIAVATVDDDMDEPAETLSVILSNHPKALPADVHGNGFITDNDDAPRVAVANITVREDDAAAPVLVTLSNSSSQDVIVEYAAGDGTAKVTKDYGPSVGSVTFTPGDLTKTVTVPVTNDSVAEWREAFAFDVMTTLNADLGDGAATATILDDDRKPSYVKVTKRIRNGRINVTGRLTPAHKGRRMTVTLKKRSHGRWVQVRTKRPLLSKGIDVNRDGVLDSKYAARFLNPRNTTRCRLIARFDGDVHHFPSKARSTFHC